MVVGTRSFSIGIPRRQQEIKATPLENALVLGLRKKNIYDMEIFLEKRSWTKLNKKINST